MPKAKTIFHEIPSMAKFALPIVLTQALFMMLGVVDTALLGRVGPHELAGAGVARAMFWVIAIFACGSLSSIDILASQAMGAKREHDLHNILENGSKFALYLSVICTPMIFLLAFCLDYGNFDEKILMNAKIYLMTMACCLPFMLFFTLLQRYWQSQKRTMPILYIVIVGNIVNYIANIILIFGGLGLPPLGVLGSGIATIFSYACMLVAIALFTALENKKLKRPFRLLGGKFTIEKFYLTRMLKYGLPAGAHQALEVGVFSLFTIFSAHLSAEEAAAHQIVLIICSFTYMFPLGLANAAAFRVGHLVGNGDVDMAKRVGNTAIVIGAGFMTFSAVVLYFFPQSLLGIFTHDAAVVKMSLSIVIFAASFQVIDAVQGCAIGALRGAGNTVYASIMSAIGFYPIALVVGYVLCFRLEMRLVGLWLGLTIGLLIIAVGVLYFWLTIKPMKIIDDTHATIDDTQDALHELPQMSLDKSR